MHWTVTLEVELPNLVVGRGRLQELLPTANVLHESNGGVQRQLTMTVIAKTEVEAKTLALEQTQRALVGLLSGPPRPVSAFADPG